MLLPRVGLFLLATLITTTTPASAAPTEAPAREHEPVVLKGSQLAGWAVPANQTAKLPLLDLACYSVQPQGGDPTEGGAGAVADSLDPSDCPHNDYAKPEVDTAAAQPAGPDVAKLAGLRWDAMAKRFVQIPFQVDEVFTRYLDNSASGFAPYSGQDQHTTYAYDREGFRWHADGPDDDVCRARPASPVASDPVAGLDGNDELAFMASDAGPRAPADARLPRGVTAVREVAVSDPAGGSAAPRYVYVVQGLRPAFDGDDGYVSYRRDRDADLYEKSESTYANYGNARVGTACDADGNVLPEQVRRRPRDGATVKTDRYRFRYDGRWLMTQIGISPDGGRSYGPDLVDRWKARAFAQDPGSETPCCGYEEEDTNWGGSSTLLGEKAGPVRAIRETWGADSGTNVIRRETFYREAMDQRTWLRVHVIPPLDGIYAQWDFNAGRMTTFRNVMRPDGVAIDGRNDEAFGNLDDPCNDRWEANERSDLDRTFRSLYQQSRLCESPYHQSVDLPDPGFSDANAALGWTQTSGPHGTIVDRISTSLEGATPGGAAQSLAAVPYYRDDACFSDGTGSNPGPEVHPRHPDREAQTTAPDGSPRRCWDGAGTPEEDRRFWQGSIGTHGLHLLTLADSDNARQTVPTTEVVADWRMVMLPGDPGLVGDRYGRSFEKPLVAVATPASFAQEDPPPPPPAPEPGPEPKPQPPRESPPGPAAPPATAPAPPPASSTAAASSSPSRAAAKAKRKRCRKGTRRAASGRCVKVRRPAAKRKRCPRGTKRTAKGRCAKATRPGRT